MAIPVGYEFQNYAQHWGQYEWILIMGTILAFTCAFGIGANDVANAFGSSVGAKAITIGQAIVIAAVCEFAGASLLGAAVTDTLKSKIANVAEFQAVPELLMFGFLAVMVAASIWDNLACHLGLPVSTTHTTVGAIIGMTLVVKGSHAVVWSAHKPTFPYFQGFSSIVASWVISPIASGILCCLLFGVVRTFILRSQHSLSRALLALPLFVFLTFFVIVIFIIQTGNANKTWEPAVGEGKYVGISAGISGGLALFTALVLVPILRKKVNSDDEARQKEAAAEAARKLDPEALKAHEAAEAEPVKLTAIEQKWENFKSTGFGKVLTGNPIWKVVTYGASYQVHDSIKTDSHVAALHDNAEVFDPKAEAVFRYLQVFSAMAVSFAHGSNDVANAVGPYSGIVTIYNTRSVPSKTPVKEWILVIGGFGIVFGLATFGYKIMRVLGVNMVKLTNSRGFCAELSTAMTVIIASRWGLPVSTTQVIAGSILAVGLFEGGKGVNWKEAYKMFFGWAFTIAFAGFVAAAIAAFGVYAPHQQGTLGANAAAVVLDKESAAMLKKLFGSNLTSSSVLTQLQGYNKTLTAITKTKSPFITDVTYLNSAIFDSYNATFCKA